MSRALMDMIMRAVQPIKTRIMMAIARGVMESVNDGEGIQLIKATFLAGEDREDIERFQNFGFTGNPPDGSECVAVFVGGNREHGLIIAMEDRDSRLTGLAKGESAQYNQNGDSWILRQNGNAEGTFSGDHVENVTGNVDLTVGGDHKETVTGNFEMNLAKLKFDNGTDEVIDLLVQTLTALIAEPFIVNKATFTTIKTKLEAFKI